MKRKYHIENVNGTLGSSHNRIVYYSTLKNAIRLGMNNLPAGTYNIHQLDSHNIYNKPIETITINKD